MLLLKDIQKKKHAGKKQLAVLIDPDKARKSLDLLLAKCDEANVDLLLIGGSLLHNGSLSETITDIKSKSQIPVVIFPGSNLHIDKHADGILLLSLVSGRNPDLLIGQHVIAAPILKKSDLEILSTGYILIDGGKPTTVSYISGTTPIPRDKPEIAACTALASQFIGHQLIYLDSGSGAQKPVPSQTIASTKAMVDIPIIVGGGLKTIQDIKKAYNAGADIVVIGNHLEENPDFLDELSMLKN